MDVVPLSSKGVGWYIKCSTVLCTNNPSFFERKRKRQVLEEEDEISADEMEKLKKEMDGFPTDFVLPKDMTGTSTAHDMHVMGNPT